MLGDFGQAEHHEDLDAAIEEPRPFPSWLIPLGIALVTFLCYLPTLGYDFVYDDYAQIVETKQLNSVSMIPRYFAGHVWAWRTPGIPGPYYRPAFLLWLLANQMVFGVSPHWWHLTSLLVHVAATVLLYKLVQRLTGDRALGAIAALLFGLHPAHLESVAWVSGMTDPLVAVCMLGSLLCFVHSERHRAASYALFAIALLAKEVALVIPLLIFALSLFQGRRTLEAFRDSLPFFLITSVYLGVRLMVLHHMTLVVTPVPLRVLVQTWPAMLVFYLRHLVWPFGLSLFYSLKEVETADWRDFWLPCAILLAVAAGLLWWSRRSGMAAFAVCLLLLPLLPVLDLRTFAKVETVHDRYLYLPSIGFCMLAAVALRAIPGSVWRWGLVLPVAAGLAFGTVVQSRYWSDGLTLFLHAVETAPDNETANQGLGTELLIRRKFTDAIPYYQHAIELNPNQFEALYALGRIYYELGDYSSAAPWLERAVAVRPTHAYPYLYYGLARFKQGQLDEAEKILRYVMRIKGPDDYREFHLALGQVLKARGDRAGALAEFQAEARENPDPAKALSEIQQLQADRAVGGTALLP